MVNTIFVCFLCMYTALPFGVINVIIIHNKCNDNNNNINWLTCFSVSSLKLNRLPNSPLTRTATGADFRSFQGSPEPTTLQTHGIHHIGGPHQVFKGEKMCNLFCRISSCICHYQHSTRQWQLLNWYSLYQCPAIAANMAEFCTFL